MNSKTIREMDETIYPVCTLCRDHEKAGFQEGVKVVIRLAQEINLSSIPSQFITDIKWKTPGIGFVILTLQFRAFSYGSHLPFLHPLPTHKSIQIIDKEHDKANDHG